MTVFSFTGIALIYWFNCRIKWSKDKFILSQTQRALQEYQQNKGTEKDPDLKVDQNQD